MSREAMKLALDMLNEIADDVYCDQKLEGVITALRQALETEQEPVAFRNKETGEFCTGGFMRKEWSRWTPLYTAPLKREWVGLTGEEIKQTELSLRQYNSRDTYDLSLQDFADAIEAKLKEKNHG